MTRKQTLGIIVVLALVGTYLSVRDEVLPSSSPSPTATPVVAVEPAIEPTVAPTPEPTVAPTQTPVPTPTPTPVAQVDPFTCDTAENVVAMMGYLIDGTDAILGYDQAGLEAALDGFNDEVDAVLAGYDLLPRLDIDYRDAVADFAIAGINALVQATYAPSWAAVDMDLWEIAAESTTRVTDEFALVVPVDGCPNGGGPSA